jgi:hypothetical protein
MNDDEQDLTKTQGMGRNFGPGINEQDPTKTQGRGRNYGTGEGAQQSGGNVFTTNCTSRSGAVIIRATVEHIGLAGDTEMTVSVKWPASSFCAPACADEPPSGSQDSDAVRGTGNGPGSYILFEGNKGASAQHDRATKKETVKGSQPPKKKP